MFDLKHLLGSGGQVKYDVVPSVAGPDEMLEQPATCGPRSLEELLIKGNGCRR